MNNERRRIKEINMLSAYLDNALKAKEAEELETRLKHEPDLREKLDNLRRTKLLISRLDRVRAPRNFTLTPDMVKVRAKKAKPLFTTLRLASSFAAILLVALFGVQLLLQGGLQPAMMGSEAPIMEEAARVSDEATPEPLIFWSQPGMGGAVEGYGGRGGETTSEEPILEIEEAAPEEKQDEPASPEEESEIPSAEELPPQETDAADSEAQEKKLEESSPILGVNPDQSGEILERSAPGPRKSEPSIPWQRIILWAQIGLAVIAVGGGITLWVLRSKRQS